MNQENFINYRRYRWLRITVIGLIISTCAYLFDSPPGGRNGGTTVGYILGVVSTLAIICLMLFGLRKRAYRSSIGTVQGWLAAHVWIGIGLLILVPLHAGFSFALNVHTFAYVLMVLTIASGIWGAVYYVTLSSKISAHRGGLSDSDLLLRISDLRDEIVLLSDAKSDRFAALFKRFDFSFEPGLRAFFSLAIFGLRAVPLVDPVVASSLVGEIDEGERQDALKLVSLLDQRSDLARTLLEQVKIRALLKVWLYAHLPLSVALCVAVAVHIISVFYFW